MKSPSSTKVELSTMYGSATDSVEDRRASLAALRALAGVVTDCNLTCEARGTAGEDDEAADEARLGRLAALGRGPVVYAQQMPRWTQRVHESLAPSHLALRVRQASQA